MGSHAGQPAADPCKEQGEEKLGILTPGVGGQTAIDELYQHLSLSGRPRRQLERIDKGK